MRIILPKTFVENSVITSPLFFLVGPVLGGGNWQESFCLELDKLLPSFFAVVPCRWGAKNNLYGYREKGAENVFYRQTVWEYHYLLMAAKKSKERKGCIVAWIPLKEPSHTGEYARDTRQELGRWGLYTALFDGHIIVGADPNFSGIDVIQCNLEQDRDMKPNSFPIYSSMKETAQKAADWVTV